MVLSLELMNLSNSDNYSCTIYYTLSTSGLIN